MHSQTSSGHMGIMDCPHYVSLDITTPLLCQHCSFRIECLNLMNSYLCVCVSRYTQTHTQKQTSVKKNTHSPRTRINKFAVISHSCTSQLLFWQGTFFWTALHCRWFSDQVMTLNHILSFCSTGCVSRYRYYIFTLAMHLVIASIYFVFSFTYSVGYCYTIIVIYVITN